jgi:phage shock protein E
VTSRAISPEDAFAALASGARLVDVRAPEEFDDGHPQRAENIPFTHFVGGRLTETLGFVQAISASVATSCTVLLLCRSGVRAEVAAQRLKDAGYTHVRAVVGGYEGTRGPFGEVVEAGWRRSGLP